MVALHWAISRFGRENVQAIHITHSGDPCEPHAAKFVQDQCESIRVRFTNFSFEHDTQPFENGRESAWREQRYSIFRTWNEPIIMGHHLDDAVETYLMAAVSGYTRMMPYSNDPVIRPFLIHPAESIRAYAEHHGVKWIEDETNRDVNFAKRNMVRHVLLPAALKVNPGIHNTIRRKIIQKEAADDMVR